ncbi:MAG: hypothetical protein ACE1ZZ_06910, partial [Dehalococcoidia bacterium]
RWIRRSNSDPTLIAGEDQNLPGISIVIARAAGPKQSHESKEGLLRFARNDTGLEPKDPVSLG